MPLPWTDPIRWIFFDLGETLIDESEAINESIRQFVSGAEEIGFRFSPEQVKHGVREAYRQFSGFPMRTVMERLIPTEDLREQVRRSMKYRKDLERPFPDSLPLLAALSRRHKLGIIANQGPGTLERIARYGFAPYFKVVCASAEAGMAKPDPLFFRMGLEQAGCPPEQAVMIGDRIDNDIVPAKRLGMRAIWVKQGYACEQPLPEGPDRPDAIVSRIGELLPLLLGPAQ
ncbi:HAD family hydrolase [Paenibacillus humicola]|uniref:HAD family hydrolase n=1 Tax=Paenibacillus humicola TaxID=3110540 RepID=UPI00237A36BA|nr:HAD family hydrolase [Paenibacillus humicola]